MIVAAVADVLDLDVLAGQAWIDAEESDEIGKMRDRLGLDAP